MHPSLPKPEGWIDENTGRIAVLVSTYFNYSNGGEIPGYVYLGNWKENLGLDFWRLLEGVDPHATGQSYDVWQVNGRCWTVGHNYTVFVRKADGYLMLSKKYAELAKSEMKTQQEEVIK